MCLSSSSKAFSKAEVPLDKGKPTGEALAHVVFETDQELQHCRLAIVSSLQDF
jgi:hypothetical protein